MHSFAQLNHHFPCSRNIKIVNHNFAIHIKIQEFLLPTNSKTSINKMKPQAEKLKKTHKQKHCHSTIMKRIVKSIDKERLLP